MREIKFRVWAIASQIMFYPDSNDGWVLENGRLRPLPNTILEQYTGLKDKNGKEIYEGDILLKDSEKFQVVFEEYSWYLIGEYGDFDFVDLWNVKLEIIGNIHD